MKTVKLNIKDQEFEVVLGTELIGEVIDILDMSADEYFAKYLKNAVKYAPLSMYTALELSTDEVGFTKSEMMAWIDENKGLQNDALVSFSNSFLASLSDGSKEEVAEVAEEGSKKK